MPEHVVIDFVEEEKKSEPKVDLQDYDHVDPVQLSVYGHRLMGIAEQVSDSAPSMLDFLSLRRADDGIRWEIS